MQCLRIDQPSVGHIAANPKQAVIAAVIAVY